MPINEYKGNFKGALTFISVDPEDAGMDIKFQLLMPGFDYDLSHPGRGASHGWFFFTTYNTEEANTLLEVNASQNDKDFIAAVQLEENRRICEWWRRKENARQLCPQCL